MPELNDKVTADEQSGQGPKVESLMKNIIDRNTSQGDKIVQEEKKQEQKADEKKTEKKTGTEESEELTQLGESEHEVDSVVAGKLTELGYDLSKDFDSLSEKDIVDILENETPKEKTTAIEPSSFVITQEYANQVGGFAKSLVGKDLNQVLNMVNNNNSEITRLRNELKTAQTTVKPKVETKETKTKTESISFDDFINLDSKEQKKFFENLKDTTRTEAVDEAVKLVEEKFGAKLHELEQLSAPLKNQQHKEAEKQIMSAIQAQLPENLDVDKVFAIWQEKVGSTLTESDVKFYEQYPNRFIHDIAQYGEKLHFQATTKNDKTELQKLQKTIKAQKKKKQVDNSDKREVKYNTISRDKPGYTKSKRLNADIEKIIARNTA